MNNFLKYPVYLFLLPLFFVMHGFFENFEFIRFYDIALLVFIYWIGAITAFILFYLFSRNVGKSALFVSLGMVMFFFFGAVHDFIKGNSVLHPVGRYSILLPVWVGILGIIYWKVKDQSRLVRFNRFLNILLIVYLTVDIAGIIYKVFVPGKPPFLTSNLNEKDDFVNCIDCPRPDIYFLVFDEYESSASLKNRFGFNNDLDTFLVTNGFRVLTGSRSNYYLTPFSIGSILNMSYIHGIPDVDAVSTDEYMKSSKVVEDNNVVRFLKRSGYKILNYSIFDMKGHPSMVSESFLPAKTKLITGRTLNARLFKHLGWIITTRFTFLMHLHYEDFRKDNAKFLKLVKESACKRGGAPRFIYAHYNMPHPPFFYDESGRDRKNVDIYTELLKDSNTTSYLSYVRYTNSEIKKLVMAIKQNNPAAIMVIMGDHGFRNGTMASEGFFKNMNAIYIPNGNYTGMYDDISGVNQFRVLFNEVFNQKLPILKDSCVYLKEKL